MFGKSCFEIAYERAENQRKNNYLNMAEENLYQRINCICPDCNIRAFLDEKAQEYYCPACKQVV